MLSHEIAFEVEGPIAMFVRPGFRGIDLISVQSQEYRRDQKRDAIVPVPIRMGPDEAKSVGAGEGHQITGPAADPSVAGARKGGVHLKKVQDAAKEIVETTEVRSP